MNADQRFAVADGGPDTGYVGSYGKRLFEQMFQLGFQFFEAFGGLPASRSKSPVKLVRDPVCGTWVSPRESLGLRAGDTTHYFCSDKCRAKFAKGS